jgi:hypothetical protein
MTGGAPVLVRDGGSGPGGDAAPWHRPSTGPGKMGPSCRRSPRRGDRILTNLRDVTDPYA